MPKPTLRHPRRLIRQEVLRVILFGKHPNPTTDYYFAGRLAADGMPSYCFVDIDDADLAKLDADGAFVILCRYASAKALSWIEANLERLAGVGLFIDDDIPSVITSRESTIGYKYRLFSKAVWPLRRLNHCLDIIWASTPELASTLQHTQPRVLPPAPPQHVWNASIGKDARKSLSVIIAYHATAIHVEEHHFLAPVIRRVLAARPNTEFEVFAGREARAVWHGMERVSIRNPLPWRIYCDEALSRRIDIMLAPLAPTVINQSRSTTKRIDVARVGAAGIFSASPAYESPTTGDEILLPYDGSLWESAILRLIDDVQFRRITADATRYAVIRMSAQASSGLDLGI